MGPSLRSPNAGTLSGDAPLAITPAETLAIFRLVRPGPAETNTARPHFCAAIELLGIMESGQCSTPPPPLLA